MLTLGVTPRNTDDVRGLALETVRAVLGTLDTAGQIAVLDVLKEDFAAAWPEGDCDE